MAISDNGQYTTSFRGSSSYVPLVGQILNKYEDFGNLSQVKFNSSGLVAGNPVTVKNQVGATANEVAIENMNSVCGEITGEATTNNNLDGFLVSSETDVVPLAGGEAYPVAGFLSFVALLGSGINLYLPADSTLEGVSLNTPIAYDFSNHVLKRATVGTDVELPIRLKSALVAAKKLTYSGGVASWGDCTAVLVELSNHLQTKASS